MLRWCYVQYNTNKQERLEAQFHLDKGSNFEAWAIEKRVASLPLGGDVIIPSTQTVASGPLLQLMMNAFCSVTKGVIVVKCASGKGKSLAARYLLSKASRGMMFVGSAEIGSYSKALTKAVGAPDAMGAAGWLRDLFI
jgi:acyl-CoA reductase-like NAD-dependent aldehyde dehydrogenase